MRALSSVAALLCVQTVAGITPACPDLSTAINTPAPPAVSAVSFNHWQNSFLSYSKAYHLVHDEVGAAGSEISVTGKFDYGAVLHKDLEGEYVVAFLAGPGITGWESLGVFRTNSDGKVFVPVGIRPVADYAVRMVVAADQTYATGYVAVVDPAAPAVLFDVDGTLTVSDFEAVGDYLGISVAEAYAGAADTARAYLEKNYRVIFLTNRPYWFAQDTREWLGIQGLPAFQLRHNFDGLGADVVGHKSGYIKDLQRAGVNLFRVYGNAETDIEAYALSGIPASDTYIIGEFAGQAGTQVVGEDYVNHLATVVANTPDAACVV